ncbi:hypothetical protein D9757_011929 [Collybiopsis confluens]|uniref:DUF6534 domain-containing protein n=1 Tax=Collybiopsis confluens TaxID=2823264 RepID=A0A8H5GKU7_9AGAR|nr:hypothetical protein D9757_011929 [Collybiopsis confluens]
MASEAIQATYYPELLGYMFSSTLFTRLFTCCIAGSYHENFPKDPMRIKILVAFLLALVATKAVLDIYGLLATFASFSVQLFYAHRMLIFSKSNYIKVIASIVIVLACFCAITPILALLKAQGLARNLFDDSVDYLQMWLTSSAVCDTLITVTMIVLLKCTGKSSDPGLRLRKVEQLMSRIIRQLIETGFVTAAFAIADLCIFMSFPTQIYHIAICSTFPDIYSLALLIILNGRSHLSESTSKDILSWNVVPGHLGRSPITSVSHTSEDNEDIVQLIGIKEEDHPFSSV